MKKRMLSLLLLAVLAMLCLHPVTADAAGTTITAGSNIAVSWNEDKEVTYTFTAPETAYYVFWIDEINSGSALFEIYDANDTFLKSGTTRCELYASAGATYSVEVDYGYYGGDTCKTTLHCKKGEKLTSITPKRNSYVGFVGETISVNVAISPMNAVTDGTWTSSNKNVANVIYFSNADLNAYYLNAYLNIQVDCKAVGTTTLTYTDPNGVKTSLTVTVKNPQTITAGTDVNLTIPAGDRVGFLFTAKEDAYYWFGRDYYDADDYADEYSENSLIVEGYGYNQSGISISSSRWVGPEIVYGCYAGNTYLFTYANYTDTTYTGKMGVHKMVPATSMTIRASTNIEVGAYGYPNIEWNPQYALSEDVVWTSSNPAVLRIAWQNGSFCTVEGMAKGTAVITATSESGLTATHTMTVGERNYGFEGKPLALGQANKVNIQAGGSPVVYEFVPSVSGYYHFDHDAEKDAVVGVVENNKEFLAVYSFLPTDHGYAVWLNAGKTYQIVSYYLDTSATGTFNLYVTKMPTATNGWVKHRGGWFYFENSKLITGWKQINSKWYYLQFAMCTGWQEIDDCWYYLGTDGVMQTGWVKVGNNWYYMNKSGVMQTGWVSVGGKWYYMSTGGVMQTGWVSVGGKWYYMSAGGVMQTGWVSAGGKWYYMDTSGVMQTGLKQVSGKYYYFTSGGVMTTGWQTVNGVRHLFDSKGAAVTGWHQESGKWYFLKNTGAVTTGWMQNGGYWYFMDKSTGVMQTGWVQDGGHWYFMNKSGVMQTGWVQDGGYWYYMNKSGVMLTGTQVISGKTYKFNSSGVWIG